MSLTALLVGFAVGAFVFSLLMLAVVRNVRNSISDDLADKDSAIDELRKEAAADRETNRRLRHEMHGLRTGRAVADLAGGPADTAQQGMAEVSVDEPIIDITDAETAEVPVVEVDEQPATAEQAAEISRLQDELVAAKHQIAERDEKLRTYREALTEIRLSLESRDPLNNLVQITEEVPPSPQADASTGVA